MKKIFILGVVAILLGSTLLPPVVEGSNNSMNEKITVRIRTSLGTVREREVPLEEATKLQSIIGQFINHTDRYETLLPVLMNMLKEYGLIKNAEKMEMMIKKNLENKNYPVTQQWIPVFNVLCFVVGYGLNSLLIPFRTFLGLFIWITLYDFLYSINIKMDKLFDWILNATIILGARSHVFIPMGLWQVFSGEIHTIGLFGYQRYIRNSDLNNTTPLPAEFLIVGFVGIWISFLHNPIRPKDYFIGSAMAIII